MSDEELARAVATDYLQHSDGRGSGCSYHTDLACLTTRILAALRTVRREERERCAKIADGIVADVKREKWDASLDTTDSIHVSTVLAILDKWMGNWWGRGIQASTAHASVPPPLALPVRVALTSADLESAALAIELQEYSR